MEDSSQQQPVAEAQVPSTPHVPSPEEIERTRKVMQDSLAGRKPKGFLESLKEWFR